MREYVWTISTAQAAGSAAASLPPQASAAETTSNGRRRFPAASRLYCIASKRAGGQPSPRRSAFRSASSTSARLSARYPLRSSLKRSPRFEKSEEYLRFIIVLAAAFAVNARAVHGGSVLKRLSDRPAVGIGSSQEQDALFRHA